MSDQHQTRALDETSQRSPVELSSESTPQDRLGADRGTAEKGSVSTEALIRRALSSRGPGVLPGSDAERDGRAAQPRVQRRTGAPGIQARFAVAAETSEAPAELLLQALRQRRELIASLDPAAGATFDGGEFNQKVAEMFHDSIDYGTIDLGDDQQLVQFYFRVKHELAGADAVEEERQLLERSSGAWDVYKRSVCTTIGREVQVFRTAILGRGASAAYAIENGSVPADGTTVLIGEEQPWRKERGETGVVNHPHNMIDPEHGGGRIADGGLAPRQDFSDKIDETINKIPAENRFDARIRSVEKKGAGAARYYEVTTNAGIFYAQRVVAALGIGKHKAPRGLPTEPVDVKKDVPRIMNMDQFQASVAEKKLEPADVPNGIVVVGPNAAIDVMTTSFREGFYPITWITGTRRPAFLKGTDNEYVEQRYDEVLESGDDGGIFELGVLKIVKHDFLGADADDRSITAKYGQREDARRAPVIPEQQKGTQGGSILVYGTGPDVSGLLKIFPDVKTGADVEPVYDVGMHFNEDGAGQGGDDLKAAIRAAAPQHADVVASVTGILGNLERVARTDKQGAVPNRLPSVVGLNAKKADADDPTSLEFVSGSAARIAGAFRDQPRYGFASKGFGEVLDELASLRGHLEQQAQHELVERAGGIVAQLMALAENACRLASEVERAGATSDETEQIRRHDGIMAIFERARDVGERIGEFTKAVFDHIARHGEHEAVLLDIERRVTGLDARCWRHITHLTEFERQLKTTRGGHLAATHMGANPGVGGLPNTLPANVVLADQLTGSRAMVEAAESSMPRSVSAQVDFITHDRTVIATHIAIKYPAIPPALLGYVTSRIIFERRHAKLTEAPLPRPDLTKNRYTDYNLTQQQEFQDGWSTKLERLQNTFA